LNSKEFKNNEDKATVELKYDSISNENNPLIKKAYLQV